MRDFTAEELAGYSARTINARDLIYVQPRDFLTHSIVHFGFWNGRGDVTLAVTEGITAETVNRDFTASGAVLKVEDIPVSDNLQVVAATVTLSQLNADVENAVRAFDMRNAPIQIYRALFSSANPRLLLAPARCRFAGFVNAAPIATPAVGGEAAVTLTCTGCTNELTRTNTDLRSDESQQRRSPGDAFFKYVAATGQIQVFWGTEKSNAMPTNQPGFVPPSLL